MIENLGIVGPAAVMAGGIAVISIMKAADTAGKYAESRVEDRSNDKARSTVGRTSNDRLGMQQVKLDCSQCSEVVTHAERVACECSRGER